MNTIQHIFLHSIVLSWAVLAAMPATSRELGAAYGREFQENTDIEHYEIFFREPLPFERQFESGFRVLSAVEIGAALIREAQSDTDEGGRFSVMPQLIFSPHPNVNLVAGIGVGFMVGNFEFTEHDLGGAFLFNSKLGIQFLLGQHFNIGYFYYHQSNADIYDHNQGLNMNNVLLSYTF